MEGYDEDENGFDDLEHEFHYNWRDPLQPIEAPFAGRLHTSASGITTPSEMDSSGLDYELFHSLRLVHHGI